MGYVHIRCGAHSRGRRSSRFERIGYLIYGNPDNAAFSWSGSKAKRGTDTSLISSTSTTRARVPFAWPLLPRNGGDRDSRFCPNRTPLQLTMPIRRARWQFHDLNLGILRFCDPLSSSRKRSRFRGFAGVGSSCRRNWHALPLDKAGFANSSAEPYR